MSQGTFGGLKFPRMSTCVSNMRQMGSALMMYVDDSVRPTDSSAHRLRRQLLQLAVEPSSHRGDPLVPELPEE
jgi:hypothetical protein